LLDDAGLQCLILQDREVAGVDFLHGPVPPPDRVREWHRLHNLVVRDIPDVADIHAANHAQTLRVSTLGPPEVLDPIERQLLDGAVGDVTAYQVDLANFGVRLLEVFGPRVSKWTAVARLPDRFGIGPDRIVAIGDDMNDLEMISRAGQGVAMGNGREAIKRAAGRTIGSNADDGLAGFLREFA
jgi:hydroxymethylpyrimidine pyrophosphatase-like HAD family hydrolase